MTGSIYVRVRLFLGAAIIVSTICPTTSVAQSRTDSAALAAASAARQLDSLGWAAYELEDAGYIAAGSVPSFYQDPEDEQVDRHRFFLTSIYLLQLATQADATNASAAYHYGVVLGDRAYKGWGDWNAREMGLAVRWLARARRLAVGRFAGLRPKVDSTLTVYRDMLSAADTTQ